MVKSGWPKRDWPKSVPSGTGGGGGERGGDEGEEGGRGREEGSRGGGRGTGGRRGGGRRETGTYETDEHFMGTFDGTSGWHLHCSNLPSESQWKLDAVKAVTGILWNMGAGRLIGRPRHARIQVLPSLPKAPSQLDSTESATVPLVLLPAPPPPLAPPNPVPTASMSVDNERSRVQEWRRYAKRQAEVPLEDLDPATILSNETPGWFGSCGGSS